VSTSADRLWHWFRRLPLWLQVVAWLFLWGPLATVWLLRRGGCLWPILSLIPLLFWLGIALPSVGNAPRTTPTPERSPVVTPTTAAMATAASTSTVPVRGGQTATRVERTETPTSEPFVAAEVVEVVDGDTLKVRIANEVVTVRLIGVDTPESVDPDRPVMCFGQEATAFTREMVARAGNRVLLEKDVSETDRYGRLLRYVWVEHPDGRRMLNYELVSQGYAQVATFPPDVKYADWFVQAQREAQENGRGLWSACEFFGAPVATPTPTPAPTPPAQPQLAPRGNCDPSYPDVCIPPPPPDLNCKDIPYRRFRVLPPDPHGFDSDRDGIGCESD